MKPSSLTLKSRMLRFPVNKTCTSCLACVRHPLRGYAAFGPRFTIVDTPQLALLLYVWEGQKSRFRPTLRREIRFPPIAIYLTRRHIKSKGGTCIPSHHPRSTRRCFGLAMLVVMLLRDTARPNQPHALPGPRVAPRLSNAAHLARRAAVRARVGLLISPVEHR